LGGEATAHGGAV